jgi:hypothetical protein
MSSCAPIHRSEPSPLSKAGPFRKVKWSDAEDRLLLANVAQHGNVNWSVIASGMPGRSGKQCRERWINWLDPKLNQENWTPEEDEILLYKQKECGNCWAKIARFLPGRSANGSKNRWRWIAKHREDIPFMEVPPPITFEEWNEAMDIRRTAMWFKVDCESCTE